MAMPCHDSSEPCEQVRPDGLTCAQVGLCYYINRACLVQLDGGKIAEARVSDVYRDNMGGTVIQIRFADANGVYAFSPADVEIA